MSQFQELLSVNDFIHRLNENTSAPIGKNTIYALIQEPDFPSVKIRSRWFVLADKVNDWLEKKAACVAKSEESQENYTTSSNSEKEEASL